MAIVRRSFLFLFFSCWLQVTGFSQASLPLVRQPIHLKNKQPFDLQVPAGYHISPALEGMERPRFFALAPDGRLFITDMQDRSDNKKGRVLILDGWNEKEKTFSRAITYLAHLHNPNQVAFYAENGQYYLYVSETGQLTRYLYHAGDTIPSGTGTVIARFPDYGLSYKYGGWHLTRSLAFHNQKLYVSVGSSCDACLEKEEIRATIVEMDPDGKNQQLYARGVRNAVGIKWVQDQLWVTHMGRDNRGPDKPEELFHPVERGGFYGWPYYYQYKKTIFADTAFIRQPRPAYVRKPPIAPFSFKAHSAPLGFSYLTHFNDPALNNSWLVALHGSTSVWRQRGNAVVQVLPDGRYREVVTGFLQGTTENKRYGRPCDLFIRDDHSFFISDDKSGVIYFVWKTPN